MKNILIIFFIATVLNAQALELIYDEGLPSYKSLGEIVEAGSRYVPVSGTGNIAGFAGGRDYLIAHNQLRIRQTGYITKVSVYIETASQNLQFKVWRKDGLTYDLVSSSETILSSNIVNGAVNTFTLGSPMYAMEGDYLGFRMINGLSMFASSGFTGGNLYYVNGDNTTATNFDWEAQSKLASYVVKFKIYMESPSFVFIGNSIIAGHPAHYSFLESTNTTSLNSTIPYFTCYNTNYNFQNMGIGSQTTANILARFKADVIDLKPKHVILEGGVNDVSSSVPLTTTIANYTAMFDSLKNHNIKASVLLIFGWQSGTAAQNRKIDSINTQLITLTNSYTNINYIDARSAVNEFGVGGDAGNLWDIKDAYDADHIHFNSAGHSAIADVIRRKLKIK